MLILHQQKKRTPQLRVSQSALSKPLAGESLLKAYYARAQQTGLQTFGFIVDGMVPKSLNHQYVSRGRRSGQRWDLDPETKAFRDMTRYSIVNAVVQGQARFEPTGVLAAVIFFESPAWMTKERRARQMDCDNKVKPLMDAIEKANGIADELYWELHVFKVTSKKTRTVVHLFDLGDIVETFGG